MTTPTLRQLIIQILGESEPNWLSLKYIAYAWDKPIREVHHELQKLINEHLVLEIGDSYQYPGKLYQRTVFVAKDALEDPDRSLVEMIHDEAWELYEEMVRAIEENTIPKCKNNPDATDEDNLEFVIRVWEMLCEEYRQKYLTKMHAPLKGVF